MRRIVFVILSAIFGLVLATTAAFADSPNFHYANGSVSTSTGALNVSFKETGLGNTVNSVDITLNVATATADYQCFNHGGNHPQAGNKEHVSTSLTNTETFPVRNGQTTGTISVGPAGPGSFSCPNGQVLYLTAVSYSGISITGEGVTAGVIPDPVSGGPFMIRV